MRKYGPEEAINIGKEVESVTSMLISATVAFAIGVVLVKLLWAWTVPDLFPTAVEQGLIASDLSWLAVIKAVALVAIVGSTATLVAGRWGRNVRQMRTSR